MVAEQGAGCHTRPVELGPPWLPCFNQAPIGARKHAKKQIRPRSRLDVRCVEDLLPPEDVVLIWRRAGKLRPQAQLFADLVRAQLSGR